MSADHCFTDPSAEIEITVSLAVQATPQTASEWARGVDKPNHRRKGEQHEQYVLSNHARVRMLDSATCQLCIRH